MVHTFTMQGRHLVLDVHSGSVHVVDEPALYAIQMREAGKDAGDIQAALTEAFPNADAAVVWAEIAALEKEGLLFAAEAPEPAAFMQNRDPVVKALCLHIAHACNLRCAYCFAGQGEYQGERGFMSLETGKKAVDFLIAHSGVRRNLEVDFFGGEPTLNFETVKGVVAYAREKEAAHNKHFRFTLTTNGLLLDDEMAAYINTHMDNVVLSLDGRKATNDRMRRRADGSGCYDDIVPRFLRLVESRNHDRYYVRGTYTRDNLDFCADVLHLADLGFTQISVEPVVAEAEQPYAIRSEDLPFLCAQYEALAEAMTRREQAGEGAFNFFHFMMDLSGGPCAAKRVTGCGAGTEYFAVTPWGDLYPCHQFAGETAFCMGNLNEGLLRPDLRARFGACTVYAKPECDACWAKFYCSGGCAANAYHTRGDILLPDQVGCVLQKKRIECALYLQTNRFLAAERE